MMKIEIYVGDEKVHTVDYPIDWTLEDIIDDVHESYPEVTSLKVIL